MLWKQKVWRVGMVALALVITGCGDKPGAAGETAKAARPKPEPPKAEPMRFVQDALVSSEVVPDKMLGFAVLPGGNLGTYKRGKQEWKVFFVKAAGPTQAGLLLFELKGTLTNPQFVPHMGGYFAASSPQGPLYLFQKNSYVAGIAGLNEQDADVEARRLALKCRRSEPISSVITLRPECGQQQPRQTRPPAVAAQVSGRL